DGRGPRARRGASRRRDPHRAARAGRGARPAAAAAPARHGKGGRDAPRDPGGPGARFGSGGPLGGARHALASRRRRSRTRAPRASRMDRAHRRGAGAASARRPRGPGAPRAAAQRRQLVGAPPCCAGAVRAAWRVRGGAARARRFARRSLCRRRARAGPRRSWEHERNMSYNELILVGQWFFFAYFVLLNLGYLALNVLAMRALPRYLEA